MAVLDKVPVLRIATIVDGEVCDELHQTQPASVSVGRDLGSGIKVFDAWELPTDYRRNGWLWFLVGLTVCGLGGYAFALEVGQARAAAEALEAGVAAGTTEGELSHYFQAASESVLPSVGELGLTALVFGLWPLIWGFIGMRTRPVERETPKRGSVRAPDDHPLFVYSKLSGYELDLPSTVLGKLSIAGRVATIGQLRRKFPSTRDGRIRVRLGRRAKGKLLIGETVVLFQLTKPARKPVLPKFPSHLRDHFHLLRMPWPELLIQLSVFALLGIPAYYVARIAEPTPPEVDERFVNVMDLRVVHQEQEPEPPPEPEKPRKEEKPKEEQPDPEAEPEFVERPPEERPKQFSKKAIKKAESVGLAKALASFGVQGDANIVDRLTVGANSHTDFAIMGMTARGNGLVAAGEGDVIVGGEQIAGEGEMAANTGLATGGGPNNVGRARKAEKKIKSRVSARNTEVFGDVDANRIRATIRRRTGALQHCFNKALRVKPNLSGRISYEITISVRGRVTEVNIHADSVRDPSVRNCTVAKIKGWRFPSKGASEPAEVSFSVMFEK